jgi:ATP-dependent DNA helicase RecG
MDKMRNLCMEAKIPLPQFSCKGNDFWTVFRKDIYNKEDLKKLGLNDRQIKAVLYVKENGRITNSEYQTLNLVSKRTATNDLSELVDKYQLVSNTGFGAGSYYEMRMGQ